MQGTRDKIQGSAVLILCCVAQFMVILDVSIVNVALPSIRDDLGFSDVDLQWVVNAYTLTFGGFLLLGGRAADLLGPRRVFVAGLLLFGFASLAGGLSQSQEMLVIARGVQGLGGAVVAPVTLSILTTTFSEGAERNKALAAWGAMGAVGGATGNLLGGVLTDLLGWQWILIINLPIGVAAAAAAMRFIPDVRPAATGRRHFDLAGAMSVTSGLIVLTYAIVRTDVNGWGSAATLGLGAVGLGLIGLFLLIERRAERPLVPLRVFGSRTLSAANFVVFLMGASAFAMWYFLSLYLQQVLGYSPIKAGLAFLPMPLTIMVASTQAARLVGRYGPGRVLAVGMLLIGAGMALLSRVPADGTYLANVFVPSIVAAAGIGFAFVPATIAATNGVVPAEAGLASGLVNTARQVGGSLGLAILATLATQRTASLAGGAVPGAADLTAGFSRAFVVGAAFALAGAAAAALLLASTRVRTPAAVHAGADA